MGSFYGSQLANLEMGAYQHRSPLQILPQQNPKVEKNESNLNFL